MFIPSMSGDGASAHKLIIVTCSSLVNCVMRLPPTLRLPMRPSGIMSASGQ